MSHSEQMVKIRALSRDGKSSRVKADYLEVDFGQAGRVLISFSGDHASLEIVAEADEGEPLLCVQPGAANAVMLRLENAESAPQTGSLTVAEVREPRLNLSIQRALNSEDREYAPRKHRLRRWARAALQQQVCAEVAVRLVSEAEGRTLNRDYRNKDCATNILTFVYDDEARLADAEDKTITLYGDLVLCVPVIVREALAQGKSPDAHFAHLVVHGMLHLQGFDHQAAAEAEVMEQLEKEILGELGYADPYA